MFLAFMAMLLILGDMLGLLWVLTLFDNSMEGLNKQPHVFSSQRWIGTCKDPSKVMHNL